MSFPSYWQTWQKYGRLRSKLIALGFFSWTGLSAVWIAVLPFRSCSETGGGRTAATGGLSSVKSVYSDVWSSPIASTSIPGAEVDVVEGVRTVDDAVETRFSRELAITKKSHENESCCVSPRACRALQKTAAWMRQRASGFCLLFQDGGSSPHHHVSVPWRILLTVKVIYKYMKSSKWCCSPWSRASMMECHYRLPRTWTCILNWKKARSTPRRLREKLISTPQDAVWDVVITWFSKYTFLSYLDFANCIVGRWLVPTFSNTHCTVAFVN